MYKRISQDAPGSAVIRNFTVVYKEFYRSSSDAIVHNHVYTYTGVNFVDEGAIARCAILNLALLH